MTTRKRRNKPQQARDILWALLKKQEAETVKHKAAYEEAKRRADFTRGVIEALGEEMLSGMELPEEPPRIVYVPRPLEGTGDKPFVASDTWHTPTPQEEVLEPIAEYDTQTKTTKWTNPRRQRSGEKAQDVNDVWPAPELGPTNHSKLMYERAKNCQLCLAGVPYATKKRTEHYVVTKDSAGVERGFEYKPCTSVSKGAA